MVIKYSCSIYMVVTLSLSSRFRQNLRTVNNYFVGFYKEFLNTCRHLYKFLSSGLRIKLAKPQISIT